MTPSGCSLFRYSRHIQSVSALETSRALMYLSEFRPTLREWLGVRTGGRICEVGCGTGAVLREIVSGCECHGVGIDRDERFIRAARFLVRRRSVNDTLHFEVADAQSLPFANGEFDACFAFGVLHLIEQYRRAVSEMFRVTRSGGRVVVFQPLDECDIPRDDGGDDITLRITRLEEAVRSRFRSLVGCALASTNTVTYQLIAEAMAQVSGRPIKIRGLFLPCCERELEERAYRAFLRRELRDRVRWVRELARAPGCAVPDTEALIDAYAERARRLMAARETGAWQWTWSAPALLVIIGASR